MHKAEFMVKTLNSNILRLNTYPKDAWTVDCRGDTNESEGCQTTKNQDILEAIKKSPSHPLLDLRFGFPGALCHRFFQVGVGIPEFFSNGLAA